MDRAHVAAERAIVLAALATYGGRLPRGLKFDRVAVGLVRAVRTSAESDVPEGTALLTVTAPILLPARTRLALGELLRGLAASGETEAALTVHGNAVRLRIVEGPSHAPRLVGFVHNPDVDAGRLIAAGERWLLSGAPSPPPASLERG